MCVRKEAVNSTRVRVIYNGNRFRDIFHLQVTLRIGANRCEEQQTALRDFLQAVKRLEEVCEPILYSDRV
jgi:hypothetical protein